MTVKRKLCALGILCCSSSQCGKRGGAFQPPWVTPVWFLTAQSRNLEAILLPWQASHESIASQWEETRCWTNVQAKRSYFLKTASLFRVSRDPSSNIFVAHRPLEPFSGERVRDWGLGKGLGERYSVLRKKTLFFFQKPLINGIICTQRVKLLFLKFRPSWLVQTGTIFCTWVIFH